jgi:hypothetical protein
VKIIRDRAFACCKQLTDVELSEDLETIGYWAFGGCRRVRRIAIPLKEDMLDYGAFIECDYLSIVDLVGGIHKTISSLLLDSWRHEMNDEIDRINRNKSVVIHEWMETVIRRIEHYKSEHFVLLKEFTTLLELALWKAKLDERALGRDQPAKKAKIGMKAARQDQRITSGASIVIKNVLPFLKLE